MGKQIGDCDFRDLKERVHSIAFVKGSGRTKQSHKKACDINEIVNKYKKTGQITHLRQGNLVYADVSEVPNYQQALEIIGRATELFNALPALARDRFGNDPEKMIAFLANPANREEAVKMGLMKEKEKVKDKTPGPTNPPPAPGPAADHPAK